MKKFFLLFLLVSSFGYSQISDEEHKALLEKSPFNQMYPKFMAKDAAAYFTQWNKLFRFKKVVISPMAPTSK